MLRPVLVTLCALALLAAGCGSDDDKDSASSSGPSASERAMKAKEQKAKEEKAMKAKEAKAAANGTTLKVVAYRRRQAGAGLLPLRQGEVQAQRVLRRMRQGVAPGADQGQAAGGQGEPRFAARHDEAPRGHGG